jgi:hypothetical protein
MAPLGHIILTSSQPVFVLSVTDVCLSEKPHIPSWSERKSNDLLKLTESMYTEIINFKIYHCVQYKLASFSNDYAS